MSEKRNEIGFVIDFEKNAGYTLVVHDYDLFQQYLNQPVMTIDYSRSEQRIRLILFTLLQSEDFLSLDVLAQRIGLSRSTLIKDLDDVERCLRSRQLTLQRKPHYGIRITGKERNIRKAFSEYVIQSEFYTIPIKGYTDFLERINEERLETAMLRILRANGVRLTDLALANLSTHYKVLLYRTSQRNTIVLEEEPRKIDPQSLRTARQLGELAADLYGLTINESEIRYFALDLQSKAIVHALPEAERSVLEKQIHEMLEQLDQEFYTDFHEDGELVSNLLLHLYPLLNRINYDFQLQNPLIDEICMEFVNVFVVALRFAELIHERWGGCAITRDEIGFLALHFAVHFEKGKTLALNKIRRIAVICSTGKSSAMLIKLKLETIFANASILTASATEINRFDEELPNLFLATIPFAETYRGVPVIQIQEFLNENELKRIKDLTALKISHRELDTVSLQIMPLFREAFFQVLDTGDYLQIIREQAEAMVKAGAAAKEFPDYVMRREQQYPTIFTNGVASPHPIHLNAKQNCIGVTILKEPVSWQQKDVQLIFLINLKSECLYFHQEIQRLLLKIIENDEFRRRITAVRSFGGYCYEIENGVGDKKYE